MGPATHLEQVAECHTCERTWIFPRDLPAGLTFPLPAGTSDKHCPDCSGDVWVYSPNRAVARMET